MGIAESDMPERAAIPEVEATPGYGADVVLAGASVEDAVSLFGGVARKP